MPANKALLIFGAVGAAVILGAKDAGSAIVAHIQAALPGRNDTRMALRAAAIRRGVDPDWLDAIGKVESGWVADKTNPKDPTTAWGATQLLGSTLASIGYGTPSDVFNPDVCGEASCDYFDTCPGGIPTFADLCAYWNAGHPRFATLGPTHPTRLDYYPRALAALDYVRANPPAGDTQGAEGA